MPKNKRPCGRTIREQQREIESLKLRLFWCAYNRSVFTETMWEFNFLRTRCGCINCCTRGSVEADDMETGAWHSRKTFNCVWQHAFEQELLVRGLTFKVVCGLTNTGPDHVVVGGYDFYPEHDCHFVIGGERKDWVVVGVGNLLGNATHELDAGLLRYKKLCDDFRDEYD